ncbi:MAG: hypothetical protein J1E95_04070, partial [Muribaculaceae bacterium]|nr:hypothetical protein [Muribaculaceae bacterium]
RMLNEYKSKVNSVRRFIEEESWIPSEDPKETTNVSSEIPHVDCRKFYKHYCEFCKETNSTPVTERDFRNKIREFFCVQTGRTANATWVFATSI